MNRIAFVFSTAPHGNNSGREGLDALLSTATFNNKIGVFFISDGIFQILAKQNPNAILARDYIVTFKVIMFYDIEGIWICSSSMKERGLKPDVELIIDANLLHKTYLHTKLSCYNIILNF